MICISAHRALSGVRVATILIGLALAPKAVLAQTETVEYYASDAIGSVRVVFNASGSVIGRMDYAPFGQELYTGLLMPSERFGLLTRDGETELDFAKARMYAFRVGRFSAPDPVEGRSSEPQEWNRYSYAVNNPFKFVDPDGLQIQHRDPNLCTAEIQRKNPQDWHCTPPAGPGTLTPLSPFAGMSPPPRFGTGDPTTHLRNAGDPKGARLKPVITVDINSTTTTTNVAPTDYNGVTLLAGVEGSLVAVFGVDASTGLMVGSSGCPGGGIAAGGFGSFGGSVGVNVSAGGFIGAVRGPVRNVGGVTANINLTFGSLVNVTLMFNTDGQLSGGTIGLGAGAPSPVLASGTVSGTGYAAVGDCK